MDGTGSNSERGLVVGAPIEIQGTRLFGKSSDLDPQELRFALLFWDKLVWPATRPIQLESGPNELFLERSGVLTRPKYDMGGADAASFTHIQVQAFLDLDRREPGKWSLAQGENFLLLKDHILQVGSGAAIELYRAIPVPDKDVPLSEVLEFGLRRRDELRLLRNELDTMLAAVEIAEDKNAELMKRVAHVDAACADALKVGKEWRFPIRLTNLKVSLNLSPFATLAAGWAGWEAGKLVGLPSTTALLFGAGASFRIAGDFGIQAIRPRQGPYRYVYQFHKELF